MKLRFGLLISSVLVGCTVFNSAPVDTPIVSKDWRPSDTEISWRAAPECLQAIEVLPNDTRNGLAKRCLETYPTRARDFVAVAFSGGGTKSAVFSGETLFYLEALGLLKHVDVLSSVSGGGFPAALYALSCDPAEIDQGNNAACKGGKVHRNDFSLTRPIWKHDEVLQRLGQGFESLVNELIGRLIVPGVRAGITTPRFASFIDRRFFGTEPDRGQRFLFRDLNPRRPYLAINATILSSNRGGLGANDSLLCGHETLKRHYLRRRNPDEFFHFAYTDTYFNFLGSSVEDFPVAGAVAASAAFPALVEFAELTDRCKTAQDEDRKLILADGGLNDNQALLEIYMMLTELMLDQRRSPSPPPETERLGTADTAYVFAVNSSVTEATGLPGTGIGSHPHSSIEWLLQLGARILTSVDAYSGDAFALRKQLLINEIRRVEAMGDRGSIQAMEISLTGLDQYRLGGTQAALWEKSGILEQPEKTEPNTSYSLERQHLQGETYRRIVEDSAVRSALRLSHYHPQCYFDFRYELDASLASLSPDKQACLRDAARWSTALAVQGLCETSRQNPSKRLEGLRCVNGVVQLTDPTVLGSDKGAGGSCQALMDEFISKQDKRREAKNLGLSGDDCQKLD